jgi:hypothetical protein
MTANQRLCIFGVDVSRYGTISFDVAETGGGGASGTVTISSGQWIARSGGLATVTIIDPITSAESTTDLGYDDLMTEIVTQLNAIGNATYTMGYDIATGYLKIGAQSLASGVTAVTYSNFSAEMARVTGIDAGSVTLVDPGTSYTLIGTRDSWHTIRSGVGGWSEWAESESDIDGEDLRGADGSTRGLVAVGTAATVDAVVPLESREKIWSRDASSALAWTFQRTLARVRTIEPCIITEPDLVGGLMVGYLRADSCTLRPRLMSADYLAYQSVPLGFYVVGRL